ncbi:MAG: PQQ-binding-like beta-propeller repeat protein, partial [Candidatus Thorarchaeota archaeon]
MRKWVLLSVCVLMVVFGSTFMVDALIQDSRQRSELQVESLELGPAFSWALKVDDDIREMISHDLDSDGENEIILFLQNGVVQTLDSGDGSPIWTAYTGSFFGGNIRPQIFDLNNDEIDDIVTGTYQKITAIDGDDGTTLWSTSIEEEFRFVVGNLIDNASRQVIYRTENTTTAVNGHNGVQLWEYNGPDIFDYSNDYYLGPRLIDLDDDRISEILIVNSSRSLLILHGNSGVIRGNISLTEPISGDPVIG